MAKHVLLSLRLEFFVFLKVVSEKNEKNREKRCS